MRWALLQQIGAQGVNFLIFFVLASLLDPSDFGFVGLASVWIAFLSAFSEGGFGAAVVQRSVISPGHLSTTFSINIATGVVLTLLGILLSWPAAWFYGEPGLQPVMAVLSLGFLIRALGLTQNALAQRELRFRQLALRDVLSNLFGGSLGIASAYGGYGVWSLVVLTISTGALSSALSWRITEWRPRWRDVSIDCARDLWGYGSRMLGFNVFKSLVQNADRLIIGYLLGARALGLYSFAHKLVIVPVATVVGAFGSYLFPRLAQLQNQGDALRRYYLSVNALILQLILPGVVLVTLTADTFVVPLFGEQWADAVVVIQILAVTAVSQAIFGPTGQLMKARNRPGWLLAWSAAFTALTVFALWVGSGWGLVGTAVGLSAAHVIGLPVQLIIANRLARLRSADAVREWAPSLGASLLAGLVLWALLSAGPADPVNVHSVAAVLFAALTYVCALAGFDREFRDTLMRFIRFHRFGW